MQDKLKRNENCIIGLPRCDYVFNSNRSCFIAYGFLESRLEMEILRGILEDRNIEVFEAGGDLEPGKNAFCTKICSKIICSQFCIVLINQDTKNNIRVPNANVNMEYGLMLGFNKYIIPFQKQDDILPFNVSGLDTIKYDQGNFKEKAQQAVKKAIEQTKPKIGEILPVDRIIESFFMVNDALICPIDDIGNRNIYELGQPFGYYLLNDYSGLKYYFLGVFNTLTNDQIKWRVNKLEQVISARFSRESLEKREALGLMNKNKIKAIEEVLKGLSSWIIVQTDIEKRTLTEYCKGKKIPFEFFSIEEIQQVIETQNIN